jgi:hypothetical protein
MARKPNYNFERMERDRLKAQKVAEKAKAKKEARERDNPQAPADNQSDDDASDET